VEARSEAVMKRILAAALLASQLGASCHHVQAGAQMQAALQQVVPPPREVRYTRVNIAGDVALPETQVREVWNGPHMDGDLVTYDVRSFDTTHDIDGVLLSTDRHFFGPGGYGFLGSVDQAGVLQPYDPPQIVLPPNPKVGQTWSAEHHKGDITSVRSCEILASDYCDAGIVVVCESHREGGVVVLRDHFCEGLGWGGFEALVQTGRTPSVRMWSEDLVRDGRPVPVPERAKQQEEAPEAPTPPQ